MIIRQNQQSLTEFGLTTASDLKAKRLASGHFDVSLNPWLKREKPVAVILSGLDSDGAYALRSTKGVGGLTSRAEN
jgi:hypothetical protein